MTDLPDDQLPPLPQRPRVPAQRVGGPAGAQTPLHPPAGTVRVTAATDLAALLRAHGTGFAAELAEIDELEIAQTDGYEEKIRAIIASILATPSKMAGASSTDMARLYYLRGTYAAEFNLRLNALRDALNLAGSLPEPERDPEFTIDVAIALAETQASIGTEEGRRIAVETLDRVATFAADETLATRLANARAQIGKKD